jgi:hypothetical protein
MKTTGNLKVIQKRHPMTNKQKWQLLTMLVLLIAWLPAFSACSSLEGAAENQRVLLLKSIEQERQKPANLPVRPIL